MTPPSDRRATVFLPILLTCASYAAYNVCDAVTKTLASTFHVTQIVCTASVFVLVILVTYAALREGKRGFRTKVPRLVLLRALLSQGVSVCNIFCLPHVKLTTFYTIIFTSPFLVALLSSVLLGEKLDRRRITAILAGFGVVLWVFRPDAAGFNPWWGVVFASALFYSIQVVVIRRIMRGGTNESRAFMFIAGAAMAVLWSAPLVPAHYVAPTAGQWGLFALTACTAVFGFICMARALEAAHSAALVAPYHYTQIVWGALLGYAVFGEVPDLRVMAGAAAIIALGLYLLWNETRPMPHAKTGA